MSKSFSGVLAVLFPRSSFAMYTCPNPTIDELSKSPHVVLIQSRNGQWKETLSKSDDDFAFGTVVVVAGFGVAIFADLS